MDANASERTESQDKVGVSLARVPEQLLGCPAALELGKRLWGPGNVGLAAGLPRRFEASDASIWLRSDDTACDLVGIPQDGAQRVCLLVPSSDAARWVDRVLGGEGRIGHARTLSEAEYGVLAYALSRGLQELAPGFQLSRVERALPEQLLAHVDSGVVWPLALHTPLGTVDIRLLLGDAVASRLPVVGELLLCLSDRMDGQLAQLEAGDVLLSDCFPLAVTASGLAGNVELRVLGSSEILSARLENRVLCVSRLPVTADSRREARGSGRDQTAEPVEFVIARRALSLSELARVITGTPLQLDEVPMDPVLVLQDGTLRAQGCLVVQRGELGVRITHVY